MTLVQYLVQFAINEVQPSTPEPTQNKLVINLHTIEHNLESKDINCHVAHRITTVGVRELNWVQIAFA